jgi:proteasome assembly chaperone (PAC2) family protein
VVFVKWVDRPTLRRPVLVAAFAGWNDAAEAATTAVRYLHETWHAHPFASIEPEEFFDFSSTRPTVFLRDGDKREIAWPTTEFSVAKLPGATHDIVLLQGTEPQLKWRTFCRQVTDVAHALRADLVLTLGALLADVPHSRPVSIIGTATDSGLIARYGLQRSRYEGPTGIVGVLQDACTTAGIASASLWAAAPNYVAHARSPKAALALTARACALLELPVSTTALEIATADYEREVSELVEADEDTADYVRRLESMVDGGEIRFGVDDDEPGSSEEPAESGSGEMLVEEVERFLREQGS